MKEIDVHYTDVFTKLSGAITSKKYDVFVLEGGSRSSKTFSIIQWLITYAISTKGTPKRVLISRKKGTWITTTVLYDFISALKKYSLYNLCKHSKSIGSGIITLCDCEFWFLGLDDEQKVHGLETDIFWINEAVEATFDDYSQLMQRCKGFAILDYNPSFDEHWIFDKVLKRDTTWYSHSTMLNNPFISASAKKQILSYEPTQYNYSQGTVDKRKWEIYGLGKRASLEGLVFNNGFTLVNEIPYRKLKVLFGMDFGFSNDVTAIVKVWLDMQNNEIYIDELCYRTQMLSTDIIKELKKHVEAHQEIISESADPRLVKEIQLAGFNIHEVEKFKGSIIAGIDKMKTMKIFVTDRSVNAIREFKNYTYMQDRSGKFLNEPIDDFNHIIDSVRYVVLMKVLGRLHKKKDLSKMGFA